MLDHLGLENLPNNFYPSHEFRFVAACSWLPNSSNADRQIKTIMSLSRNGLNWDDVTSLIRRHDVVGQFCKVMVKLGWPHVPADAMDRLKHIRTDQAAQALGQVAELARVGACFAKADVPIIPLKGVALSQELYGNPCVRSSCDLDILIKPEDVSRCEALLTSLGYCHGLRFNDMNVWQKRHIIETTYHHEYVHSTSGIHLELHWRSNCWTKEQVAALWDSSSPLSWLDCELKQLSPENTALFLMDHGARHEWTSFKWLSDVAVLLDNLTEDEWHSLFKRAIFFDLQRVVAQTATLLLWFFDIEHPQQIKEFAESDVIVRKISVKAASRLLAANIETPIMEKKFPGICSALLIKRLKPATPVMSLFRGVLITYDDFNENPLPDNLFWLYAVMRPYYWFKRRCMKR